MEVAAGKYYAVIQFLGFKPRHISEIKVEGTQVIDLGKITLVARQALLDEIVVTGKKATVLHQIDKQIYTADNFGSALGGNAIEVVRNLPSVSVNAEGEMSLRGSGGFIVLLDGKAIQTEPMALLGQLPANSIEHIEVITTPSAKFDPDGKGGIINIITKRGSTDGYSLIVNLQQGLPSTEDYGNEKKPLRFGGDITSNIIRGPWNVSLSANYKRDDVSGYREGEVDTFIDGVHTSFPSLGERSYKSLTYGIRGVAAYRVNKKNFLEAGFFAGKRSQFRKANIIYRQRRMLSGQESEPNSFDYFNKNLRERKGDFMVMNLDYNHLYANSATLTLSTLYEKTVLGGPTSNTDVNPEDETQVYNDAYMKEDNPLHGVRVKADYEIPLGKKIKVAGGYQYRYLLHKGNFEYSQADPADMSWYVRPELSNKITLFRHIHALYWQLTGEANKLSYSAGLRYEYVNRRLEDEAIPKPYRFERFEYVPICKP